MKRQSDHPWSVGVAVLLAFAALSLLAGWPGLSGTWVYDDLRMVGNPAYTDLASLFDVFTRTSADYLKTHAAASQSFTYRPVTMATLIATHVFVPEPWAHHLVSWALHLVTACLLYRALAPGATERNQISVSAAWLSALFLLHPATVETYVWINGRSDLVAGALFAGLAAVRVGRVQVSGSIMVLWVVLCFAGAAAKLPFVVAAGFLWLGSTLRAAPEDRRRGAIAFGFAAFLGTVGYATIRWMNAPVRSEFASGRNIFEDASLWAFMPKLASIATATLFSLKPEVMQSLAWCATRSWELDELGGAVLLMLGLFALIVRRDWGGLAYATGAFITLAPAAIVSRAIWLGFDRYLYMPMILILLAIAPYLESLFRRASAYRWLAITAGSVILLVAAANTRVASAAYRSHRAFLNALISERPDDPTVYVFMASQLSTGGEKGAAARVLANMPGPPWPKATIIPQLVLAQRLNDPAIFERAIVYGSHEYADDPLIQAHAMRWHYDAGRLDSALDVARSFPIEHSLCAEVTRQLLIWARSSDAGARDQLLEVAGNLKCTDEGAKL